MPSPSARFALETAILDWLGKFQGEPLHRLLATNRSSTVELATLVFEPDPKRWPGRVDEMVTEGSTHLKFKVGAALENEIAALSSIRDTHPNVVIRLDGNRGIDIADLERHAAVLASFNLEMFEEPVPPDQWREAVSIPLPFALDETLSDEAITRELLNHDNVVAIVLKLAVIGGITAALDLASIARNHGAEPVLSHTFDGPIARAASAEVALALACDAAAGLGPHPTLDLWPDHSIAAISEGKEISPHSVAGLGFVFGGVDA